MRSEHGQKPLNLRNGGIDYRSGRSKAPEERSLARAFVAYYRGNEVYCRGCLPRGEDGDEFERLWSNMDPDESDIEFVPVCLVCGREFPEYVNGSIYADAFAPLRSFDYERDSDSRFEPDDE